MKKISKGPSNSTSKPTRKIKRSSLLARSLWGLASLVFVGGLTAIIFVWKKNNTKIAVQEAHFAPLDENLASTLAFDATQVTEMEFFVPQNSFRLEKKVRGQNDWGAPERQREVVKLLNLLSRIHFKKMEPGLLESEVEDLRTLRLKTATENLGQVSWSSKYIAWTEGKFKGQGTRLVPWQKLLLEQRWEPSLKAMEFNLCKTKVIRIDFGEGAFRFEKNRWVSKNEIKQLGTKVEKWLSQNCTLSIDALLSVGTDPLFQKKSNLTFKLLDQSVFRVEIYENLKDPRFHIFSMGSGEAKTTFRSEKLEKAIENIKLINKNESEG